MPLITCNLAKGIAPRLHEPKPKAKSHTKMDGSKAKPTPKNCKRVATSDEESEEEAGSDSQLSDDEAMKPKKKESKRQHVQESDSELIKRLTKPFKYSIRITNSHILNSLGVDLRSKLRK